MTEEKPHALDELNPEQRARAAALSLARRVLIGGGLGQRGTADPVDAHALAVFILDGGNPWQIDALELSDAPTFGDLAAEHVFRTAIEEARAGSPLFTRGEVNREVNDALDAVRDRFALGSLHVKPLGSHRRFLNSVINELRRPNLLQGFTSDRARGMD